MRAEIRREMETDTAWENWFGHVGHDWDRIVVAAIEDPAFAAHNGKSLGEIARALNRDPWDTFFAIARTGAFAMPQSMSEANKIKAMQQDFVSFDTDAGPAPSPERGDQSRQNGSTRSGAVSHPRAFGAFPRVLARYVRDLGALTLEGAIQRMTAVAANEIMAYDRGRLATGTGGGHRHLRFEHDSRSRDFRPARCGVRRDEVRDRQRRDCDRRWEVHWSRPGQGASRAWLSTQGIEMITVALHKCLL